MKKIHLIRHAKSSWSHPGIEDVDRPLNKRGRRACEIMAQPILEAGCSFQHVFCSVAKRAQLTIDGLAHALPGRKIKWQLEKDLYTFSWHHLLYWIHGRDDAIDEVVIVGHNPAITEFCNEMTNTHIPNVPTCGYVQLTFPTSVWIDLCPGSGELGVFLTPKTVE